MQTRKKVLMVNWSWYPTGGDWTYVSNMKQLYEANGYEVIAFSTKNEKNFHSPYEKYFIEGQDYKALNKKKSIRKGIQAVRNSIYSYEANRQLSLILQEHRIAFAHLHNIHHYHTPGIIWNLKKNGIKVIWSLHDYKIICPENSFVSNGKVCERCIKGQFKNCTINRCKKGSFLASALATVEAYIYHKSAVYQQVDAYLCPSIFLQSRFLKAGFDANKMYVSRYCYRAAVHPESSAVLQTSPGDKYMLYVGRIEKIKGLVTLIDAAKACGYFLKIAGDGTALSEMKQHAGSCPSISFLGLQSKENVGHLLKHAAFVICPSEWYENFPFAVIEALSSGKAVIGARIGGIPELVLHEHTGMLFNPGAADDLKKQMQLLWNNEEMCHRLGENARRHVLQLTDFSHHWNTIQSILKNLTHA